MPAARCPPPRSHTGPGCSGCSLWDPGARRPPGSLGCGFRTTPPERPAREGFLPQHLPRVPLHPMMPRRGNGAPESWFARDCQNRGPSGLAGDLEALDAAVPSPQMAQGALIGQFWKGVTRAKATVSVPGNSLGASWTDLCVPPRCPPPPQALLSGATHRLSDPPAPPGTSTYVKAAMRSPT